MKYKHKKTGKIYKHLAIAIDCTNERDGLPVVVYAPDDEAHTVYIREQQEFIEKFEILEEAMP